MSTRLASLALAGLVLWTRPVVGDEAPDGRTGAWDRSVALEAGGQLAEAERVMLQAHGERPENYWAGLRLAYLALLQERYQEARSRYQALRERPEAEGDTDVVRGLASAVAGMGWENLSRGELAEARAEFGQALAVDPENRSAKSGLAAIRDLPWIFPEAWTGIVAHNLSRDQWTGWAGYAQVVVKVSDILAVRAAGRLVRYWNLGRRSPWAPSNTRLSSYTLDEEFLGMAHEARWWGVELVGARSDTSVSAAILGGAGRLRAGSTWGVTVESALLSAKGGPTNIQARPMAFLWLGKKLGLRAGARLTWDDRGDGVSANAGVSAVFDSLTIAADGHVGNELWSFGFAGPSIMSFEPRTTYGGCATALWSVSKNLRLALQGEGERLRQEGASGVYWSISGGVQLGLGAR